MKIKKIILVLIIFFCLCGCVRLDKLNYDDIVANFNVRPKNANTFRNGYKLYIPKGLSISNAGMNYMVLSTSDYTYYLYFDLIAFNNGDIIKYEEENDIVYSRAIKKGDYSGYIKIKNTENNKYLIEIVYNYAKIEVMVENVDCKEVLVNAICILNSIKYDKIIIENLLKDDSLDYTEEIFDMFEKAKDNSNILDYTDETETDLDDDEIVDTDFIN